MKRIIWALSLLLALALTASLFTACRKGQGDQTVDYQSPYDWEYTPEFTEPCDADMTIDGNLDEACWNSSDRKWMTFSDGDVTVWHTARFSQRGLYIASRAKDTNFVWNARFNYSFQAYDKALNSAFAYVIAGEGTTDLQMFSMYDFAVDTHNRCSYEQTRFAAKAVTDQPIESGQATEMTAELFVTWEALNVAVNPETGMPDTVRIIPYYRHIGSVTDPTQNKWVTHLFAERYRLHCYATFDRNGYAFSDSETAVWGNSATGTARSAGWDLSRVSDGIVTTNAAHSQAIFLRDPAAFSDRYVFSVTMRADGGIKGVDGSDGLFRGGICNATNSADLIAVYLNGAPLQRGQASLARLQPNPWTFSDNVGRRVLDGYDWSASDQTVRLTVIKDGGYFYYLVEDQLVWITYEATLTGKTFPGVYTLSSTATFSDPSFTDYSGRETELKTVLETYVYRVDTPVSVRGGTLEAAAVGVDKTQQDAAVSVLINPNPGYVLTGFTVNGESLIEGIDSVEWIRAHIKDNRVTLPLCGSVSLDATFTRFDRLGDLITLRGDVTAPDGVTRLGGAAMTAYDAADPLFSYTVTTNAQGRFEISFLRPREDGYEIGGRVYHPGDAWRIAISTTDGYPTIFGSFSLADADADGTIVSSFRASDKLNLRYLAGSGDTSDTTWNDDGSFTLNARAIAALIGLMDNSSAISGNAFLAGTDIRLFDVGGGKWGLHQWNTYGIAIRFSKGNYLLLGASLRADKTLKIAVLPGGNWRCELEPNADADAVNALRAAYGTRDTLNIKVLYTSGTWSILLNDVLYGTYTDSELGVADYGTPVSVGFGCRLDDSLPQSATFSGWYWAKEGDEAFSAVARELGLYCPITFPEGVTAEVNGIPLTSGDLVLIGTRVTLRAGVSDAFSFVAGSTALETRHKDGICEAAFTVTGQTEIRLVESRTYRFVCDFPRVGHGRDADRVTLWVGGVQLIPEGNSFTAPVGSRVVFSHPEYMDVSVTVGEAETVTVSFVRLRAGLANAVYEEESGSLRLTAAWKTAHLFTPAAGQDFAVELTLDPLDLVAWQTYGIELQVEGGYFSFGFSRRSVSYENNGWAWGFVSPSKGDWTGSGLFAKCGRDVSAITAQLADQSLDAVTVTLVYHSDTGVLDAYVNGILIVNYAAGLTKDVTQVMLISTDGPTRYLDWNWGIAGDEAYAAIIARLQA